ncbi:LacI family DNA-binding transcriptional regulator [Paraflavitalea speifideaquila]|uniref:LacI family DNA-binding transcriptional regulator n=1 Tax=Paraflavitalea speifideaquila TaxID=3076558 RepID=UPI0028ED4ACE|nr:LacI family DNA-binding transcriptional regulator [Paraflavitalea speifideiaquila]
MDNKLPTVKEIARRLNVSVSTVSRALSNHPRIGLRTKTKVQELAKELDYEPNAKAIFFKQRKSFIVGVILPYIREEFFQKLLAVLKRLPWNMNIPSSSVKATITPKGKNRWWIP